MRWKLEGYNTETQRVQHRQYTRSKRLAERWQHIPKIQFSDSGHGIVFTVEEVPFRHRQESTLLTHLNHVPLHTAEG
jgi:hypothetical protein